jgi:hypothetical protein
VTDPVVDATDLTAYQGGDPEALIAQATALVRRYCRWHVTPSVTETVFLDGSGALFQPMPTLHVTAVASVTEDGVLVNPATYQWSSIGHLWRAWPWSGHFRGVEVEMTHGYTTAEDVAGVILAIASRAQVSPNGVVRTQAGPFSETYSQTGFNVAGGVSMVEHELAILDRYRLPPRP